MEECSYLAIMTEVLNFVGGGGGGGGLQCA